MTYDEDRAQTKRHEIEAMVADSLQHLGIENADRLPGGVLREFANVTAPESPARDLTLVTMTQGGVGGGSTAKPGNVTLRAHDLITGVVEVLGDTV